LLLAKKIILDASPLKLRSFNKESISDGLPLTVIIFFLPSYTASLAVITSVPESILTLS